MPANDVKLLKYRRRSETRPATNIRQAVSEDCLLNNRELEEDRRPGFSMLKLSKTRISVGDSVTVYWDIREQCGADDWIGLFDFGRCRYTFVAVAFLKCNAIEMFIHSEARI